MFYTNLALKDIFDILIVQIFNLKKYILKIRLKQLINKRRTVKKVLL